MTALLNDIKAFCKENYENGYDAVVECWDDSDHMDFIQHNEITSVEQFKKAYAPMIERRQEIEATIF